MTLREFEAQKKRDEDASDIRIAAIELEVSKYQFFAKTLIIIGVIIFVFGWLDFFRPFPKPWSLDNPNSLGDFLAGTVGTLWALAGLIYIYIAFLGQKIQIEIQVKELRNSQYEVRLTRLEMRYQRAELIKQSKEAENQGKIFNKQNFERTLFSLVQYYKISISDMRFHSQIKLDPDFGLEAFRGLVHFVIEDIGNYSGGFQLKINRFDEHFERYEEYLSPYFRTLYRVFKYIDDSEFLSLKEKYEYSSIVRGFLSSLELNLLYFNGLGQHGSKFKKLVEKYSLLKHMDYSALRDFPQGELPPFYHPIAFADGEQRDQLFEDWLKNT